MDSAHGSSSYPLAYCLVVLPLSVTRWRSFDVHHHVSSAGIFFGVTMYNLSGAINVLLFLAVRPQLLLFPRPDELPEQEMELAPQSAGSTMFADPAKLQHSPEPTSAALGDEDFRSSAGVPRASSSRLSDDI